MFGCFVLILSIITDNYKNKTAKMVQARPKNERTAEINNTYCNTQHLNSQLDTSGKKEKRKAKKEL